MINLKSSKYRTKLRDYLLLIGLVLKGGIYMQIKAIYNITIYISTPR